MELHGNVCEIGDVLPDTPGFRLLLDDGRVVTVLGLTRDEVRALPFLQDATLAITEVSQPSTTYKGVRDA